METAWETIMKFLDVAAMGNRQKSLDADGLASKVLYAEEAGKLEAARRVLRGQYYTFDDWQTTGEYVAPEIKRDTTCPVCHK